MDHNPLTVARRAEGIVPRRDVEMLPDETMALLRQHKTGSPGQDLRFLQFATDRGQDRHRQPRFTRQVSEGDPPRRVNDPQDLSHAFRTLAQGCGPGNALEEFPTPGDIHSTASLKE